MVKRGFTLVELLIVIAILAVLAGILFTVFAPAKEKARQTHCMNNLKQLGAAILLYKGDYDGGWPPLITAIYPAYVPDTSVLLCPDDGGERSFSWPEKTYCSYARGPGADCLPFLSGDVVRNLPPNDCGLVPVLAVVKYGLKGLPICQCFHHLDPGSGVLENSLGSTLKAKGIHSCFLRLEQDGNVRCRLVPEQVDYFDVFSFPAQAGMSLDEFIAARDRLRQQLGCDEED